MACIAATGCSDGDAVTTEPDINAAVRTLQARQPTVGQRPTEEQRPPEAASPTQGPVTTKPSALAVATRPPATIAPATATTMPTCAPGTLRPPGTPTCIPCQVGQFYTPGDTECRWPPTATVIAPTPYVLPTVYVPPAPTVPVTEVRLVKIIDSDSVLIQFGYSLFVANYGVGCLGMWRYEGKTIYLVNNRYSTFIGVGASFLLPNGDDCRIWTSEQVQ